MPTAELILLMLAHRDTYRLAALRLDEAIRAIESTNPVQVVECIAAVAASTNTTKLHTPLFDALEQEASAAMPPTAEAPRPVADPAHPHGGGAS
jgi:hypothetical protein